MGSCSVTCHYTDVIRVSTFWRVHQTINLYHLQFVILIDRYNARWKLCNYYNNPNQLSHFVGLTVVTIRQMPRHPYELPKSSSAELWARIDKDGSWNWLVIVIMLLDVIVSQSVHKKLFALACSCVCSRQPVMPDVTFLLWSMCVPECIFTMYSQSTSVGHVKLASYCLYMRVFVLCYDTNDMIYFWPSILGTSIFLQITLGHCIPCAHSLLISLTQSSKRFIQLRNWAREHLCCVMAYLWWCIRCCMHAWHSVGIVKHTQWTAVA